VLLSDLTWVEAERRLGSETVVVIPLGAAAKEHGPHLRLDNDFRMAEGLRDRVLAAADVVVAPTIPYHFYPAFVQYPGSTTLEFDTARAVVVDVCRSLARHGPRRFYILNTGVSTVRPLAAAKTALAEQGILLGYTDLLAALEPFERTLLQQDGGTHADEGETSMMLSLAPERVDMTKAVRDIHEPNLARKGQGLSRIPDAGAIYSPTGVFGDATLATRAKGDALVDALMKVVLADLDSLRTAPLPAVAPPSPSAP
jgi:creatinine amidohydrolase